MHPQMLLANVQPFCSSLNMLAIFTFPTWTIFPANQVHTCLLMPWVWYQVLSSHGTDIKPMGSCIPCNRISTTCEVSMLSNDVRECKNIMWWSYISPKSSKTLHSLLVRVKYGVSFVDSAFNSTSVIALMYSISSFIGPCCNCTLLYFFKTV